MTLVNFYSRFVIVAIIVLGALSAEASSIVVLQGNASPFGRRYFAGFSSSVTEKVAAFQYDGKKEKILMAQIKKLAPDLILTIGEIPIFQLVTLFPSTPIVVGDYYASSVAKRANVVMMDSEFPVGAGLTLFQSLFPTRKTIGTLYNPRFSQSTVDALTVAAAKSGVKVVPLKVETAGDVSSFVPAFGGGKVDMFCYIRDATTTADSAIRQIYAFAEQNNLPVFSLDPSHMDQGALLTISLDPIELGEQAWNVSRVILKEGKIPLMPVRADAKELSVAISMKVATKFGITSDGLYGFLKKSLSDGYSVKIEP